MAHSLQGVYAPLPQSLSDSDSEKEVSMEPICSNYSNNSLKSAKMSNFPGMQNGHNMMFKDITEDLPEIKRTHKKMSSLRKTAFIFSILLCFLPIVIFLWVLPCTESNTCPVRISNWEIERENIELEGKINLVYGSYRNVLNIALMYKGSLNTGEALKNGVMFFSGRNGDTIWNFRQESYPLDMNCSIIDVDGGGLDCLVTDKNSLKAIKTLTGEAIWHVHSAQEKFIPELDMPIKLEDFDNDGVEELLSVYKKESFLLISGKNGKALQNIRVPSKCSSIGKLTRIRTKIRYICISEKKSFYEINISDLQSKYKNLHENVIPKPTSQGKEENLVETGNKILKIKNDNSCPRCRTTIHLLDSNNTLIRSWSYANSYAMQPITYSLPPTEDNLTRLRGHVHGFVLKIWHWHDRARRLTPTTKVHRRSISVHNETYHLNEVSERVMLITFRENDPQVINVSMTDICIICNGPNYNNCQPDYEDQKNSLLISDLDHDNSLELISYYSTYVRKEEKDEVWYLVTKLSLFRLESELPKLYGIH